MNTYNASIDSNIRAIDAQVARQIVAYESQYTPLTPYAQHILYTLAWMTNAALGRGQVCLPLESCVPFFLPHDDVHEDIHDGNQKTTSIQPSSNNVQELIANFKTVYIPRLAEDAKPYEQQPLVLANNRLYLARYYFYEIEVLAFIQARLVPINSQQDAVLKTVLARLFPVSHAIDWQKIAAATACVQRFSVITGGPGTGKTTTVTRLLSALLELNSSMSIALAAPTGKAAARMTESIRNAKLGMAENPLPHADAVPENSYTLHRLLGWTPRGFLYNAQHVLPFDCVVVDEASMVDLPMMHHLLSALAPTARLILLGDRDQLASVEAGSVLADLCDAGNHHGPTLEFAQRLEHLTGYELSEISEQAISPMQNALAQLRVSHRFNAQSGIGQLAAAVNVNNESAARLAFEQFADIQFVPTNSDVWYFQNPQWQHVILKGYHDYCAALTCSLSNDDKARAVFDAFNQFQVLVALRQGVHGVEQVNTHIVRLLRTHHVLSGSDATQWYVGRPVMIRANDYDLGLFNGDVGVVLNYSPEEGASHLRVAFPAQDGSVRWLLPSRLPSHETAFAMTVHKSQGSEFTNLCLLLPDEWQSVITRELIYTAITRAKKQFYLFSTESCWVQGLNTRVQRASGLRDALWLA